VKDNWEKLVVLLTELVDLYRAILNLSKQKREALIAAKTQDIDTVTRQEELLILQVGKFEAARGKLMRQIADSHGLDVEVLTLSKMQELAGAEYSERLAKVAEAFDKVLGELAGVNEQNTELIQQALGFINYNINLLTRNTASPTYAPQNQGGQTAQARKLVDRKV